MTGPASGPPVDGDRRIYHGTGRILDPTERDRRWPDPPHWRAFGGGPDEPDPAPDDAELERRLGRPVLSDHADPDEVDAVNAALRLRRPLLVTGRPGSGRSSLAYRIARELRLGRVLRWPVTTHDTVRAGLYDYDPVGRVRAAARTDDADPAGDSGIGDHVSLGPLGTALLPYRLPRVLLIDELDQSDIDLPQQLRTVFDDGGFDIPQLLRTARHAPEVTVHTADPGGTATVREGRVRCHAFPLVVMTCAEDRVFPPAFLRHCLRLRIQEPDREAVLRVIDAHFPDGVAGSTTVVEAFLARRGRPDAPTLDQLLDAVHLLRTCPVNDLPKDWDQLLRTLLRGVPAAEPR
ncbi:ATP-binding protein [Micromonospora endolithica]|uniref:MoxR family ATPase n=1 Tax=Micromonospora endolithica TaxID=230091 RepID=A0A3A9YZI7_9ACTN|nr:ATP-binding protein [Micromonospora endolithica]RKN41501.1 MoxR family ATPase [Micromonospora endolithica]TWJ21943.1 MoxR-like ATPase [Micromonospora endolithica]